ncbi:hypothetical protein ACS0TY_014922 [Phlomoides rotata]
MVSHRFRLLLGSDISMDSSYGNRTGAPYDEDANFDSNMVIILAALLCALLCALGINSIVRCVLGCSHRTADAVAVRFSSDSRQIPVAVYKPGLDIPGSDCPICLGEFVQGEDVGIFPKCNHGFHVKCINRWLVSHSSCPNCRQPLVEHSRNGDDDTEEHARVIEIR